MTKIFDTKCHERFKYNDKKDQKMHNFNDLFAVCNCII